MHGTINIKFIFEEFSKICQKEVSLKYDSNGYFI
jgi:hypothetical protein